MREMQRKRAKVTTGAALVGVASSVGSNVRMAMQADPMNNGVLTASLTGSGLAGVAAIWGLYSANVARKNAAKIGDQVGQKLATTSMGRAGAELGGSVLNAGSLGCTTIKSFAPVAVALGLAGTGLFAVGTIFAIGQYSSLINDCRNWRNNIDKITDSGNGDHTDFYQLLNIINSLVVTEQEEDMIRKDVNNDQTLSHELKAILIEDKIKNAMTVKINNFKRKVSYRAAAFLLEHGTQVINTYLNAGEVEQELLKLQMKAVMQVVKTDNKKKEALYWLMLTASIVSLIGLILFSIGTCGIAPAVLFAITALVICIVAANSVYTRFTSKKAMSHLEQTCILVLDPPESRVHLSWQHIKNITGAAKTKLAAVNTAVKEQMRTSPENNDELPTWAL